MWHRLKLAALCSAVAVFAALDVVRPATPPGIAVLTASHDLSAGARLLPSDVTAVRFPRGLVPDGSLTQLGEVVGQSPAAGIARGAPITRLSLVGGGWSRLDSGRTAVAVRLSDSALADLLTPGQRVRLIAVDPRTPGAAETIVESAVVLAIPTPDPKAPAATTGRLAVFEVPTRLAGLAASSAVSRYLTVTWGD